MNELLKKSVALVEAEDTQAIAQRRGGGATPTRPGGGIGGTGGRFRMIAYLDMQDE